LGGGQHQESPLGIKRGCEIGGGRGEKEKDSVFSWNEVTSTFIRKKVWHRQRAAKKGKKGTRESRSCLDRENNQEKKKTKDLKTGRC